MLAYLFGHQPDAHADVAVYEDVLRQFHATLAEMRPRGFDRSLTYRHGAGYTDWYLLEDSCAMDALNEAAVTGARAASHRAAARMATNGVGKLMSLVAGHVDLQAGVETRFAKPPGMAYDELYETLGRWTKLPGTALWRRMMVLGPPPEFTLVSTDRLDLPAEMRPETVLRAPI